MHQVIYILPTETLSQKFYKPDMQHEFTIFNDRGVYCPKNNPYKTNKGRISVTAVCYDCESFVEWVSLNEAIFCSGNPKINIGNNYLKEYLDPIEV